MDILKVVRTLADHKVRCSLVGGCAVALHGVVRGTIDLDLIIEHTPSQFKGCEAALKSIGYVSRLPVDANDVFSFKTDYIQKRNLIAWSFYSPRNPLDVVDIVITHDLRKMNSIAIKFKGESLPVLSIADLISMKKSAGRPQDLEDIKMLNRIVDEKK